MTRELDVALIVVKTQVAPLGRPAEQVKVTFPVKPFWGVIVIVVLPVFCPATAVTDAGLGASVKPAKVASQACARLKPSTDPRPVTWS